MVTNVAVSAAEGAHGLVGEIRLCTSGHVALARLYLKVE